MYRFTIFRGGRSLRAVSRPSPLYPLHSKVSATTEEQQGRQSHYKKRGVKTPVPLQHTFPFQPSRFIHLSWVVCGTCLCCWYSSLVSSLLRVHLYGMEMDWREKSEQRGYNNWIKNGYILKLNMFPFSDDIMSCVIRWYKIRVRIVAMAWSCHGRLVILPGYACLVIYGIIP